MKILLIADHESKYIWDHFDASRFADIDLIISCGDLKSDYLKFVVTMINKPLFYVHGNHDTEYARNPPEGCESIEDRIVVFGGLRFLGLGGSMRYGGDKSSTQPPYQYTEQHMARRIRKLRFRLWRSRGFDVLVTHSPAHGICDGADLCHTGFRCLRSLLDRWKPALMIHGHMHMGFGRGSRYVRHGETRIYDAFEYHVLEI